MENEEIELLKPVKVRRVSKRKGIPTMNMKSKVGKYFVAHRIKGLSKTAAIKAAGISSPTNIRNYENLPTYKRLEQKYADVITKQIGLDDVAIEHMKNIKQDQDKGAKNRAIELFLKYVEPETTEAKDDNDNMIVVLSD